MCQLLHSTNVPEMVPVILGRIVAYQSLTLNLQIESYSVYLDSALAALVSGMNTSHFDLYTRK
jgi:hypothetical protein